MSNQKERDWSAYYHATAGRPPRKTLLTALAKFEREDINHQVCKFAVDLGCGTGSDTLELIQRGWSVLAIDAETTAIEQLYRSIPPNSELLQTKVAQFNTLKLPENVNLINASFCLPFCQPDDFPQMWDKIVNALISGGRFSGQLFGDRDSWNIQSSMIFHTRTQVETLLTPFTIESLEEEEYPGETALDENKYWHIFHIVARKT